MKQIPARPAELLTEAAKVRLLLSAADIRFGGATLTLALRLMAGRRQWRECTLCISEGSMESVLSFIHPDAALIACCRFDDFLALTTPTKGLGSVLSAHGFLVIDADTNSRVPFWPLCVPKMAFLNLPRIRGASCGVEVTIRDSFFGPVSCFVVFADGRPAALGYGHLVGDCVRIVASASDAIDFLSGSIPIPELCAHGADISGAVGDLGLLYGLLASREHRATWERFAGVRATYKRIHEAFSSPGTLDWLNAFRREVLTCRDEPGLARGAAGRNL